MQVSIDAEHGGRWTSVVAGGREWLWKREASERATVSPGDRFVDAGGLEECLPTIRGVPDHGDVWSRTWERAEHGSHVVRTADFSLERSVTTSGDTVRADYSLDARPGYRFVWAGHALLDLAVGSRVEIPGANTARLFSEAAVHLGSAWRDGADYLEVDWPACGGLAMNEFGPDDGSAVGAIVLDASAAVVHDGEDRLEFTLIAPGLTTSIALWRNLGGFPTGAPYRSIGVEPMLGQVWDVARATRPDDAVTVPANGRVTWSLLVSSISGGAG